MYCHKIALQTQNKGRLNELFNIPNISSIKYLIIFCQCLTRLYIATRKSILLLMN